MARGSETETRVARAVAPTLARCTVVPVSQARLVPSDIHVQSVGSASVITVACARSTDSGAGDAAIIGTVRSLRPLRIATWDPVAFARMTAPGAGPDDTRASTR